MCIFRFFFLYLVVYLAICLPHIKLFAQNAIRYDPIKVNKSVHTEAGHFYNTVITKDSITVTDIDLREMIDVIIEFNEKPLFLEQNNSVLKKVSAITYQQMQIKLNDDIIKLFTKAINKYALKMQFPEKKREFHKIFNGVSYRIPKMLVTEIESLPYVKKVHPNKIYHVNIIQEDAGYGNNISMIGADSVWYKYNDQGDSIIVGILDTGIDYMHPALGGGYGKGYKVIGGYDFVNNDSDPMDDYSHGTHVAGIVAANSDSIKGVAPKALLMAFKVLDEQGSGNLSDVIAGVERAVDPNNDGNDNDKVDIVNMSMGGANGDPDDALCTAVNNAANLGVVFCVASGNDHKEFAIESPGAAASALTVGAVDNQSIPAEFSSKGPVKFSFDMKPDVLAPGVNIISSVPDKKYRALSGTSMSTPHAAGLCALVKYLHRDWTPEMIKSAIMASAKDLGYEPMSQGAGLINAMSSVNTTTLAIPSCLSLGIDNSEENVWIKKDTIEVINKSEIYQTYNVVISNLIPGVTLVPNPVNFSLLPGQSQNIVFGLYVYNNAVPFSAKSSRTYHGKVYIKGEKDVLQLPWTFIKTPVVLIEYDKLPYSYFLYNSDNLFTGSDGWHLSEKKHIEQPVLPGKYNLFFVMYELITAQRLWFIVKENIDINGYKKIVVNSKDADKIIEFSGADENGTNISNFNNTESSIGFVLNGDSNTIINSYYLIPGISYCYSSAFSENIQMFTGLFQNTLPLENKIRVLQFPLQRGLNKSIQLKNSPEDFIKEDISIFDYINTQDYYASFLNMMRFKVNNKNGTLGYGNSDRFVKNNKWKGTLFMNADSDKEYGYSTELHTGVDKTATLGFETEIFRAKKDSIGWFSSQSNPDFFFIPQNKSLLFGDGAIYPFINFKFDQTNQVLLKISSKFYGQLRERRFIDENLSSHYLLDEDSNLVVKNYVADTLVFNPRAARYKYICRNNHYRVCGFPGSATAMSSFDLNKGLTAPPTLTSLRVLDSKGIPVNALKNNETGKINFSIKSSFPGNNKEYDITQAKVFIQSDDSSAWNELRTQIISKDTLVGVSYSSEIGNALNGMEAAKVDLKIFATDNQGNSIELVLEPSFIWGDYNFTQIENENIWSGIPQNFELFTNYPNPFNTSTAIRYDLPKPSAVKIEVFDILGRKVSSIVNENQDAGKHKAFFNAMNLSSGIYIISMIADGHLFQRKTILLK